MAAFMSSRERYSTTPETPTDDTTGGREEVGRALPFVELGPRFGTRMIGD